MQKCKLNKGKGRENTQLFKHDLSILVLHIPFDDKAHHVEDNNRQIDS